MKIEKLKTQSLGVAVTVLLLMQTAACNPDLERHPGEAGRLGPGEGRIKLTTATRPLTLPDSDLTRREPENGTLLTEAIIEILAVDVRGVDGRWYRFRITPYELDLISLDRQFTEVLGRARALEGEYSGIRLITAENGRAFYEDGRQADLTVPSGSKTGIKIELDPPLRVSNGKLSLVGIAFDVNKSFVFTGADFVIFKPVLKVTAQQPVECPAESPVENGGENSDNDGDSGAGTDQPNPEEGATDPEEGSSDPDEIPTDQDDSDAGSFPPVFGV